MQQFHKIKSHTGGHGGAEVTHLPPTSEVGGSNPGPYVGKLVVAYRWSAVYSTEPWHQLYVLVSSARKTTHRDTTCTVLKATLKPQINKHNNSLPLTRNYNSYTIM